MKLIKELLNTLQMFNYILSFKVKGRFLIYFPTYLQKIANLNLGHRYLQTLRRV